MTQSRVVVADRAGVAGAAAGWAYRFFFEVTGPVSDARGSSGGVRGRPPPTGRRFAGQCRTGRPQ
jgi:hypothetical protein